MIIPIVVESNSIYNCWDIQPVTLSKWLSRDYHFMLANSWIIPFEAEGTNRQQLDFYSRNKSDTFTPLHTFHGINLTRIAAHKCEENIYEIIIKELSEGKVVICSMQVYEIPWDNGYQTRTNNHWFIINGIDSDNKYFHCVDAFYNL